MGSLKDALKAWKAQGRAQEESKERAKFLAEAAAKAGMSVRAKPPVPAQSQAAEVPASNHGSTSSPVSGAFSIEGVRPIGKTEEFIYPKPWVEKGAALQPPNGGQQALTVRIGIDFGTAYTKVAISAAQKVFFLHWEGISESAQHFLSGVVSVGSDGVCYVGRSPHAARYLSDLKLPFLPRQQSGRTEHVAAIVYLAWVMRYARAWFFERNADLCKGRRLVWEANIGCPTDVWDDKPRADLYEFIGHAAWRLSLSGRIDVHRAQQIADELSRPFVSEGLEVLGVVPEFVGQIAGYVRSPQRQPGLHLMVDCGAGTVDVVTFNVHKNKFEDADRYPIWASAVEPLGGHFLMAERAKAIGAGVWDDSEVIPSRSEVEAAFPDAGPALASADAAFRNQVSMVVQKALDRTRAQRNPLAQAWHDGLPLFVTGGGAFCDVYSEAVSVANTRAKGGFRKVALPKPSGAEGLEDSVFHRLSVAYGLTFDRDSLGHVIPAKDLEDLLATQAMPKRNQLDRDELYPK